MPSSYTSSLRLTLPVQGELAGSWGNTVNTGITQLVDTSVAGTASITMTAANYTLTNNNGATDESRSMFLVLGGTPGNSFNVICPAVSKLYFVTNNTGFAQTVKTPSGSGISVPNGASMALRCDGTNVVEALNAFGSLTINTGKVLLSNGQSYAIKSSGGATNDVIGLTAGNVLVLGGGGATDSVQFWNQGVQRMTLDSSGNLGLGVTPSAWSVRALQLTGSPAISAVNGIDITYNAFYDGAWKYVDTARALHYSQAAGSGEHRWFTAPSGTAGAAITFTQAMTLDASGNLGVGTTTTSSYRFNVLRADGNAAFFTDGVTADLYIKCVSGVTTLSPTTDVLAFGTNSTERARITSGGDLLVGTTSNPSSARVNIETTGVALIALGGATAAASFQNTSSAFETGQFWNKGTTGDNIFAVLYTETSATARGSIDYNRAGGLTRYNTTSDYRAKDIIGPVQNPGATIDALKVYEGVMKGATQSRPMLVAHEAQAHAPYAVSGVKDEINEDGTPKYQQIDVSSLVPLLLAEIQSLRARVAQLESKA